VRIQIQAYFLKAIELNICKYLIKPFSKNSFIEALEATAKWMFEWGDGYQITLAKDTFYTPISAQIKFANHSYILTKKEKQLFEYLLRQKDRVVSFEELEEFLWNDYESHKEALKALIKELRKSFLKASLKMFLQQGTVLSLLNKIHNLPISIKTKTMVLVLALFILMSSLFSVLRYLDVKEAIEKSRKDFKEQIFNIHNTTLNRIEKFYVNRAHANIESYGIKESLQQGKTKELKELSLFRWNVLKQENPFLINMRFYNQKKEKLVTLGEENENSLIDFQKEIQQPIFDFVFNSKNT